MEVSTAPHDLKSYLRPSRVCATLALPLIEKVVYGGELLTQVSWGPLLLSVKTRLRARLSVSTCGFVRLARAVSKYFDPLHVTLVCTQKAPHPNFSNRRWSGRLKASNALGKIQAEVLQSLCGE